jgi:hypothetical protein
MKREAIADLFLSFQRSHCFYERRIEAAAGSSQNVEPATVPSAT